MSSQSSPHWTVTEGQLLRLLLDVTNDIVSIIDMREMLAAISKRIRSALAHDYLSVAIYDKETDQLRSCALDFPESRRQILEGLVMRVKGTAPGKVFEERTPLRLDRLNPKAELSADVAARVLAEGLRDPQTVNAGSGRGPYPFEQTNLGVRYQASASFPGASFASYPDGLQHQ